MRVHWVKPPLLLMLLLNFARCWLYFKPSSGWWFGTYFIFPYIGSRCHHAQHVPHKGTIHGTKCHACHAKTHLASQPRARVISEETRPRHIRGKFPRHNRGAFQLPKAKKKNRTHGLPVLDHTPKKNEGVEAPNQPETTPGHCKI